MVPISSSQDAINTMASNTTKSFGNALLIFIR
jgi:hypothetical protein